MQRRLGAGSRDPCCAREAKGAASHSGTPPSHPTSGCPASTETPLPFLRRLQVARSGRPQHRFVLGAWEGGGAQEHPTGLRGLWRPRSTWRGRVTRGAAFGWRECWRGCWCARTSAGRRRLKTGTPAFLLTCGRTHFGVGSGSQGSGQPREAWGAVRQRRGAKPGRPVPALRVFVPSPHYTCSAGSPPPRGRSAESGKPAEGGVGYAGAGR